MLEKGNSSNNADWYLIGFLIFAEILEMLNKNQLEKLVTLVK